MQISGKFSILRINYINSIGIFGNIFYLDIEFIYFRMMVRSCRLLMELMEDYYQFLTMTHCLLFAYNQIY